MTLQLGTALELDGFDATLLDALTSQRSRMEKTFTGFDGWSGSTRCSAWNAQQTLIHVCGANRACVRVLRGSDDEKVEENFDPNSSPGKYVEMRSGDTPQDTLDHFAETNADLFDAIAFRQANKPDAKANAVWGRPVDWRLFVTHMFWDAWMHERDILVSRAEQPATTDAEERLALTYGVHVTAVYPHVFARTLDEELALTGRGGGRFTMRADADAVVVTVDDDPAAPNALTGDGATVIDALAGRGDLEGALHGPTDRVHALAGLADFLRAS
jgi:hypothetical protein